MTVEGRTELNVTGLTPFFSYTFSVTAENSVSSQDPNTAVRTVSVSVTTLEGGMKSISSRYADANFWISAWF